MRTWVFLLYRLPSEPSAPRVQAWRKLKRLGAILLEHAVWALPGTPALVEQMQRLAQAIIQAGGSASAWQAQASLHGQDEALIQRFMTQAQDAYDELQRDLAQNATELPALLRRYRQIRALDYFHVERGEHARRALEQARRAAQERGAQ